MTSWSDHENYKHHSPRDLLRETVDARRHTPTLQDEVLDALGGTHTPTHANIPPNDDCGSCGAHIGPSTEFPWHYEDEDCRGIKDPIEDTPAIGSRWYAWGEWWVVEAVGKEDDPTVTLKLERSAKRTRYTRPLRLFARRAQQRED